MSWKSRMLSPAFSDLWSSSRRPRLGARSSPCWALFCQLHDFRRNRPVSAVRTRVVMFTPLIELPRLLNLLAYKHGKHFFGNRIAGLRANVNSHLLTAPWIPLDPKFSSWVLKQCSERASSNRSSDSTIRAQRIFPLRICVLATRDLPGFIADAILRKNTSCLPRSSTTAG